MKTIAVEANPNGHDKRYPDYSVENPGLISMISKTKALGDRRGALQQNEEKTDRVLIETANGRGWLPSAGQTSDAFKELKSLYDIILMDAPPILSCSETERLVSIADATLLIILARKTSKKQIKQTVVRLERLSPASVGTIVNRVSTKDQPASTSAAR
jgi:Mrp family chromosome partitioning ATPase